MSRFYLGPKDFVASPEAMSQAWSPADALDYTRWLATHHYENFHVVSFLLPKRLHQDFYNVYAFCRWADDLGDEIGDTPREPASARPGGANELQRDVRRARDASGFRSAAGNSRTPLASDRAHSPT